MRNDIKEKLQTELDKQIKGEPQVVYILSRVRKILEIDRKEEQYKKLKFYCDWALHSEINNVGAVKDLLYGIIAKDNKMEMDFIVRFDTFHNELKKFLSKNGLSSAMYDSKENVFSFNKFLSAIYSDTPLIVDHKIKVVWKGRIGGNSPGDIFKVESI